MKNLFKKLFVTLVVGVTVAGIVSEHGDRRKNSNPSDGPIDLPAKSWKRALKETKEALKNKELSTWAASLAYYGTFALFPSLVAFISIFSLVISPDQLQSTIRAVEVYIPSDIADVLSSQLTTLTEHPKTSLVAAIVATAIALWGASGGAQNLIKATNYAYDVPESRGFVKLRLAGLLLVLLGFLVALPLMGLLVMKGNILVGYGAPDWTIWVVNSLRWLVILIIISLALAAIYRYGPNRQDPQWQWVSWGAAAATLIWLIASALFFFYLQNFANYQASYGIFAGIIALMLWLNVSAFIILLGAEVNHRLEKQAAA